MDGMLPKNYSYALIIFINSSIRTNFKTTKRNFLTVAYFSYIEKKDRKEM